MHRNSRGSSTSSSTNNVLENRWLRNTTAYEEDFFSFCLSSRSRFSREAFFSTSVISKPLDNSRATPLASDGSRRMLPVQRYARKELVLHLDNPHSYMIRLIPSGSAHHFIIPSGTGNGNGFLILKVKWRKMSNRQVRLKIPRCPIIRKEGQTMMLIASRRNSTYRCFPPRDQTRWFH